MEIASFYHEVGGDYREIRRTLQSDRLIHKYILRFPESHCFEQLKQDLDRHDYASAFIDAHSLKGVCQNIGFRKLRCSAADLTELLRKENHYNPTEEQLRVCFRQVEADYEITIAAVKRYSAEYQSEQEN